MSASRIGRLWQWMTGPGADWTLLWLGLAMLTVMLLILTRTRWGQSRALEKCVFLSLLAHLLLAGLATTVQLVNATAMINYEPVEIRIVPSFEDVVDDPAVEAARKTKARPWDRFSASTAAEIHPESLARRQAVETSVPRRTEAVIAASATETMLPSPVRLPQGPAPDDPLDRSLATSRRSRTAQRIETEPAQRREPNEPVVPERTSPERAVATDQIAPNDRTLASPPRVEIKVSVPRLAPIANRQTASDALAPDVDVSGRMADPSPPVAAERYASVVDAGTRAAKTPPDAPLPPDADHHVFDPVVTQHSRVMAATRSSRKIRRPAGGELPKTYQMRVDSDRTARARKNGATARTEAAVQAALKWLAAHQSADGRWDADRLGAGRENQVAGHDRSGAGTHADTGITGLALLAFLGSGHTHLEGPYRDHVRRGLEFLLRSQDAQGNLAGEARLYAKMYCHGMASFALGEGYALSGDERLRPSVRDAIAYTASSQHKVSGGWRYQPGDVGDMSQFGWQVMALHSADLAGVKFPMPTRRGAVLFLRNSRAGIHGGRAAYKVGHATSRVMTAEALVCRQFLELPLDGRMFAEAGDFILGDLPGNRRTDLYYWYYATIGMFQLQGQHWRRWNDALRPALIDSQRTGGDLAGSWDPDTRWGGYGGRAYSTAMASLCLEVYYRYLPKSAQ